MREKSGIGDKLDTKLHEPFPVMSILDIPPAKFKQLEKEITEVLGEEVAVGIYQGSRKAQGPRHLRIAPVSIPWLKSDAALNLSMELGVVVLLGNFKFSRKQLNTMASAIERIPLFQELNLAFIDQWEIIDGKFILFFELETPEQREREEAEVEGLDENGRLLLLNIIMEKRDEVTDGLNKILGTRIADIFANFRTIRKLLGTLGLEFKIRETPLGKAELKKKRRTT